MTISWSAEVKEEDLHQRGRVAERDDETVDQRAHDPGRAALKKRPDAADQQADQDCRDPKEQRGPHAREIAVPPNRISQIIRGRRNISGDTALRLGHWFGTSAQFWLNLQSSYEIRLAQEKAGDEIARLPVRKGGNKRAVSRILMPCS